MLTLFQNEWDALMLETFTLKQHLETVRQELSHALYQHDAACRVIARLIKERDAARNLLSNAETQITDAASKRSGGAPAAAAASADAMQTDEPSVANGMAPAIVKKMEATSKDLQKSRKERFKKKILPPNLATPEDIAKFTTVAEQSLHKANQSAVTCCDTRPFGPAHWAGAVRVRRVEQAPPLMFFDFLACLDRRTMCQRCIRHDNNPKLRRLARYALRCARCSAGLGARSARASIGFADRTRLRRPGVLCIDLHSTNADLVLSGGADSTAVIYNRATKKVVGGFST
jgi:hypothetical protein